MTNEKTDKMMIGQTTGRDNEETPEPTYEEAFAQLEEILDALETGDLPLEESLKLYELGAQLAAFCTQKLDEAELRVRQWQPGDETTPFEEWQEP